MKNPETNNGDNNYQGCHNDNTICGQDGNDKLDGNKGNDTIYGGEGDDIVHGGRGKDEIWGAEGNDQLFGGRGDDILSDRDGINVVDGGHGKDIFMLDGKREDYRFEYIGDRTVVVTKVGVPADEFQTTLKDIEIIRFRNEDVNHDHDSGEKLGNENPDTEMTIHEAINGCYQNIADFENTKEDVTVDGIKYDYHYQDVRDTVGDGGVGNGGEGEDNCFIGGGDMGQFSSDANYFIQGSAGNDKIAGNDGNDRLQGGAGDDRMWGNGGDDIMRGGKGDDIVKGGHGNDKIRGCEGDDYVSGEWGDDIVFGGKGNDEVDGGDGNDILYGGQGDDLIFGCAGDDILVDEEGTNMVKGGAGEDTFVLTGSREDYKFTIQEDGTVIVTRAEGAEGPEFTTTLVDVENVVFDATDRNLEGNHLQNFVDNAFENGTVFDIYEDLDLAV